MSHYEVRFRRVRYRDTEPMTTPTLMEFTQAMEKFAETIGATLTVDSPKDSTSFVFYFESEEE